MNKHALENLKTNYDFAISELANLNRQLTKDELRTLKSLIMNRKKLGTKTLDVVVPR